MKLQKTTDYKQFKFFVYNRDIYDSHVQNLVKSIGKHDLLEYFPILLEKMSSREDRILALIKSLTESLLLVEKRVAELEKEVEALKEKAEVIW